MKDVLTTADRLGLHLFDRACADAVRVDHMRFAWIGLVDRARSRVVPVAAAGYGSGYLKALRIDLKDTPYGRGPTGRAVRAGLPRSTYDMARDPDYWPWRTEALSRGFRSGASVPIRRGGVLVAVLALYAPNAGHFDVVEVENWRRVAAQIGDSLDVIDARSGSQKH